MLFTVHYSFTYSCNNVAGFSNPNAYFPLLISDYHNGTKTHLFTTFTNFGHTFNRDDTFRPF